MSLLYYGTAPRVLSIALLSRAQWQIEFLGDVELEFSYFPTHIVYILTELIKNSVRATIEHHGLDKDEDVLLGPYFWHSS